jgi:hypothetical protein
VSRQFAIVSRREPTADRVPSRTVTVSVRAPLFAAVVGHAMETGPALLVVTVGARWRPPSASV